MANAELDDAPLVDGGSVNREAGEPIAAQVVEEQVDGVDSQAVLDDGHVLEGGAHDLTGEPELGRAAERSRAGAADPGQQSGRSRSRRYRCRPARNAVEPLPLEMPGLEQKTVGR